MKMSLRMERMLRRGCQPEFTNEEFEQSHTQCGEGFKITDMIYEVGEPNYPTQVYGVVKFREEVMESAKWDEWGDAPSGGCVVRHLICCVRMRYSVRLIRPEMVFMRLLGL